MVTIPNGFRFATARAGFRKAACDDTALVVSDVPASAAGTFTLNKFPAAPVQIGRERLKTYSKMQAILMNSGQANACTGANGLKNCHNTLKLLANVIKLTPQQILPASTGIIGTQFNMELWENVMPILIKTLGKKTPKDFAKAIMTTDAFPKFVSKTITLSNGEINLLGIAKGAGMICPNMATMLSVILCDVNIEPTSWQRLISLAVSVTFNRVSVDGDTSTNDTVYGLANGCSGVTITDRDIPNLETALIDILGKLAYMLVQDGEGATKVASIQVIGATSDIDAELVARTVGNSQLFKTALFGQDANWGRIIGAIGRSNATFNPEDVKVNFCDVEVFCNGQSTLVNSDELLTEPLKQQNIPIKITLGTGGGTYTLLTSDLGYNYIKCNADYRS